MVRVATPDSPRSIVLATVIDALNKADGNSRRFRTTSVAQYQQAVLAALTSDAESPVTQALALGDFTRQDRQAQTNVVDMWDRAPRGA